MLHQGGYPIPHFKNACYEIADACSVCPQARLPAPCKKISLSHVRKAFNIKVQADFMFTDTHNNKYCVLHIVDTGSRYSEVSFVSNRSCEIMENEIKRCWMLEHGSSKTLSVDSEFTKVPRKPFLTVHNIKLAERPVRCYNETGILERRFRTIKLMLERLQHYSSSASDSVLLARSMFYPTCLVVLTSCQCSASYLVIRQPSSAQNPSLYNMHF